MPYDNDMGRRGREGVTRNDGNEDQRNIPNRNNDMNMTGGAQRRSTMTRGSMRTTASPQNEQEIEDVYAILEERMCLATEFHSQLADLFCFLGLQGFKRMCEYQFMKECAESRKLHRRYIDNHHRIIPENMDVYAGEKPAVVPAELSRYTTQDIDDNVIPKYVRMALTKYYDWETETKEIMTEQCERLMQLNAYADYEFIKELILDVEKEIKKIMRLYEKLNGTGYDVTMIHGVQDAYHEKYKKKYQDHFTMKNNKMPLEHWDEEEDRPYRRNRIGY